MTNSPDEPFFGTSDSVGKSEITPISPRKSRLETDISGPKYPFRKSVNYGSGNEHAKYYCFAGCTNYRRLTNRSAPYPGRFRVNLTQAGPKTRDLRRQIGPLSLYCHGWILSCAGSLPAQDCLLRNSLRPSSWLCVFQRMPRCLLRLPRLPNG